MLYTIEVDLDVTFDPPMNPEWVGIQLTKSIELPFVPYERLGICGKDISEGPGDESLVLEDIVWDADRGVFTAETAKCNSGNLDLESIRAILEEWVERGWTWGSYLDKNEEYQESLAKDEDEVEDIERVADPVLGALIRTMTDVINNPGVAFAMHRVQILGTDNELRHPNSALAKRWKAAVEEWENMDAKQQIKWTRSVVTHYPDWSQVIPAK